MTLALYGKSRGRKSILILAALLSVLIGMAGGATLRNSESASAATQLPSGISLEQWQPVGGGSPQWITGALNSGKSDYAEGEVVPFRLTIPGSLAAGTYQFSVCPDYSDAGKYGYIFFAKYDTSRPAAAGGTVGPTVSGFTGVSGVSIDNVNSTGVKGSCANQGGLETIVTITKPATTTDTYVVWGGHIAAPGDLNGLVTSTTSAHNYPGGSLHMKTIPSKDVGLQTDAIVVPPSVAIAKTHTPAGDVNAGGPFSWVITLTVTSATTTANATVTDTIPTGMTPGTPTFSTTATAGKLSCLVFSAPTLTCTLASGAAVGTYTITIPMTAPSSPPLTACAAYRNSATLSGGGGGVSGSPATDDVTVVNCTIANLTATKTNSLGTAAAQIGVPFNWTLTVANSGTQAAVFAAGQTVFTDNLPAAGATYGALVGPAPAQTNLTCALVGTTISCVAGASGYTLAIGGSFTLTVPTTPTVVGSLVNPAGTGVCKVDPDSVITESNETDNACTNTVPVGPDPAVTKVANGAATTPTSAAWTVTVNNAGANAVSQTVKLTEDAGATFGTASFSAGGSCAAQSGTDIVCTLPAGSILTIPVTKAVTATCAGSSAVNSVTLFVLRGAGYVQVGAQSNVSVAVPGDLGLCTRQITVCKVITNNLDGVNDAATFGFTTTVGASPFSIGPVAETGAAGVLCAPAITAQQNQSVTVAETGVGGSLLGWNTPTFTFTGGQTGGPTSGASAVVAVNTGNVTVTFTNQKQSRVITVCKVVTNNNDGVSDSGTFTFDSSHDGVGTDASILQSEANTAPCQTFTAPITGFSIAETLPDSSWTETGWTVTGGGVGTGSAAVGDGTTPVTVTFTNVKASRTLQVCKIVEDNGDEIANQGGVVNFSTTGTTNTPGSVTRTEGQAEFCGSSIVIPVTAVSVTELLPAGFTNAATYPKLTSSGASASISGNTITVAAGAAGTTSKVTFTNKAPTGSLNIIKTIVPASDAGKFDLDRDGGTHEGIDKTDGGSTGPMTVSVGTHSVSEFAGTGTSLSDYTSTVSCNGDTAQNVTTRTVTVAEGANVVCTFTNTRKPKLTVTKVVNPVSDTIGRFDLINGTTTFNNGGSGYGNGTALTTGPQFAFIGANDFGESAHAGTLLPDYVTTTSCVKAPTGAAATYSFSNPGGSVTLAAGDDVTCTITNNRKASITVRKVTAPESDIQDFTFSVTSAPNSYSSGTITLDTDPGSAGTPDHQDLTGLVPGTYTVSETNIPSGWQLTNIGCSGLAGQPQYLAASAVITALPGDTIICTFTDTKQARIIVEKDTLPASDVITTFEFHPSWSSNFTLNSAQSNDSGFLAPATYSVTELAKTGWDLTSATCSDQSPATAIVLSAGEVVTCTFTNTQRGTLIINKFTDPASSTQKFNFTVENGPSAVTIPSPGLGNGGTFNSGAIKPGSYNLAELSVTGWHLGSMTCIDSLTGGASVLSTTHPATKSAVVNLDPGETVTCTFNNAIDRGKIVINKVTVPAGGTGFGFTANGFVFTPSGLATGTISDGQSLSTLNNLLPGMYSAAETDPTPGYDLTSIVCSDANDETGHGSYQDPTNSLNAIINVDPGQTVTCTFTNTKRASLTITKVTNPTNSGSSTFTFNGDASNGNLPTKVLDTNSGDATNPSTFTYANLVPGNYGVTEAAAAGWDLSNVSCPDPTGTAPLIVANKAVVNLNPGDNVICTFTNTQRGSITVIKDAVPNDAQDFGFTLTGQTAAILDDDGDNNNGTSNTKTWTNLAPGSFTLTETGPISGWDLTDLVCDTVGIVINKSAGTAGIDLHAGESVTCTYTNTKRGKIITNKVTVPASDTSFPFDPSWSESNFALTNGGTPNDSGFLAPAPYTVAELPTSGWDLTSVSCDDGITTNGGTINLAAGQIVHCTFTNTKRGSITIVKDVVPNDAAASFNFTIDGPGVAVDGNRTVNGLTEAAGGHPETNLLPGAYTVTEVGNTGYSTTVSCTNDATGSTAVSFTLAAGQDVTCTFVNSKLGRITIVKDAVPNGPQAFAFTTSGAGLSGFSLDDDAATPLSDTKVFTDLSVTGGSNAYDVTETATVGWDLTNIVCTNAAGSAEVVFGLPEAFALGDLSAHLVLHAGDDITCTFTNTQRGKIITKKVTIPASDTTTEFEFNPDWSGDNFTLRNSASNDSGFLVPGTYSVEELAKSGWDLTSAVCDGEGNSVDEIVLGAGETVTCTFTNTQRGKIITKKVTIPASDTTTEFEFNPNWSADNFTLLNGASNDSGFLAPGTYSVEELAKEGWDLTSSTCSDNSPVTAIVVSADETVTCTFTNTQRGTIQVIKIDNVAATDPQRPAIWNFTITGPNNFNEARTIALGGGTATITNVPLGAGYAVVETEAKAGACPVPNETGTYRTTGPGGSQTVTAGGTATFTFTNSECGIVLSTGRLVINKVNDLNGNHIQDAGETGIAGWSFTVKGPQFPAGAVFLTDANGQILGLDGIKTGSYTITEETRTSHAAIGVLTDDNGPVFTAGAVSTTVDLTFEDTDTATFYNRPNGSIEVTKSTFVSTDGGPNVPAPFDLDGWLITVKSAACGISTSALTGLDGRAVFNNLPINCHDYVVAEDLTVPGAPGYLPVGAASVGNITPGSPATKVAFTNRKAQVTPACTNCEPIIINTPTPAPTATNTPKPTNTPVKATNTPVPPTPTVNVVAGEKTPGPQPTPLAPRTGEGLVNGVTSFNSFLAILGLLGISAGFLVVGLGRKRRSQS